MTANIHYRQNVVTGDRAIEAVRQVCHQESIFAGDKPLVDYIVPPTGAAVLAPPVRALVQQLLSRSPSCSGRVILRMGSSGPASATLLLEKKKERELEPSTILNPYHEVQLFGPGLGQSVSYQAMRDKAIATLANFAVADQIRAMSFQVITQSMLCRLGITQETEAVRFIENVLDDCAEYSRSMVVFDLESLLQRTTDDRGVARARWEQVMLTIFERFMLRPTNHADGKQLWICLLSGSSWSTAKIVEHAHMDWPLEERQQDEKQRREETCWYCNAKYTAESNDRPECSFHEHRISPEEPLTLTYEFPPPLERSSGPQESRRDLRLTLVSYQRASYANRLLTIERETAAQGWQLRQKREAAWSCCLVSGIHAPGCQRRRHRKQYNKDDDDEDGETLPSLV